MYGGHKQSILATSHRYLYMYIIHIFHKKKKQKFAILVQYDIAKL